MRKHHIFTAAILMSASLALGAGAANAAQANTRSCIETGRHVRAALNNNEGSANYRAAMKQRNFGLLACNAGLYKRGMAHYAVALKLLHSNVEANAGK